MHVSEIIFQIKNTAQFNEMALNIFRIQAENNKLYHDFINNLQCDIEKITHFSQVPFLPIELFKNHCIVTGNQPPQLVFTSSGTTGRETSHHYITDIEIYHRSFLQCFELFYGKPDKYIFLALLPSYLGREGSSLVYMMEKLIQHSSHPLSAFFHNNTDELVKIIKNPAPPNRKYFIWGVTYALLKMAQEHELNLSESILLETGGMKGRMPELTRSELHQILCSRFHCPVIHSEYGMTELLSQAYSSGNGIFKCPPWMAVLVRDPNDPFNILPPGKRGGINIIDLANLNSCAFIATSDLGIVYPDGSFEVAGRFDASDIRGCNLLMS